MLFLLVATSGAVAACTSQPAATSSSTTTAELLPSTLPFKPTTTTTAATTTTSLPPPACVPPDCASPTQVSRFVALADKGPREAFVATYRFLDTKRAPLTFVYTSNGGGFGSVYTYEVSAGGTRFRAVHLAISQNFTNFYECLQHGAGPWSCYGPDPSQGNGGIFEVQSFDVAPDYLLLFHPPADESAITTRQIGPFKSTCLTYTFEGPKSRGTWCITSAGILDYFAGLYLYQAIELVSVSMGAQPSAFELPAPAATWPRGRENEPGNDPAFAAPGFDL
jgi:hypothetical protein